MDRAKNTPVPIFNYRKRPRQAIVADPQDGQGSSKYPDLMPLGGFDNGNRPNKSGEGSQKFSSFNSSSVNERGDNSLQKKPPGCNYMYQGHQQKSYKNNCSSFSSNISQQGDAACSNRQLMGNSSGFQNQNRFGNYNRGQLQRSIPSSTTTLQNNPSTGSIIRGNSNHQYGQQQNSSSFRQNLMNKQESHQNYQPRNNQSSNLQGFKNNHRDAAAGTRTNQQTVSCNPQSFVNRQQSTYFNQNNDTPSMFNNNNSNSFSLRGAPNTGGLPVDNSPARGSVFPVCNKYSTTEQQQMNKKQQTNTTKSLVEKKKIDSSLHVFTLRISRVPYWAKYRDSITMLFEVYGKIDSAVIRDPTGSYKEFILRDEQHQIKCIFYEIDRTLPKLIRGHWHRCMGTYDVKKGYFKCVSVRPATVEEKTIGQENAEVINELLKQMTKHLPEQ